MREPKQRLPLALKRSPRFPFEFEGRFLTWLRKPSKLAHDIGAATGGVGSGRRAAKVGLPKGTLLFLLSAIQFEEGGESWLSSFDILRSFSPLSAYEPRLRWRKFPPPSDENDEEEEEDGVDGQARAVEEGTRALLVDLHRRTASLTLSWECECFG